LQNAKLFHLTEGNVAFLQTLVALKSQSRLWVGVGGSERTGCGVWQPEFQASNVAANVQDHLLHGYMLPVFFVTDQLRL